MESALANKLQIYDLSDTYEETKDKGIKKKVERQELYLKEEINGSFSVEGLKVSLVHSLYGPFVDEGSPF